MQVSTTGFYDRAAARMGNLSAKVETISTQLSGTRLQRASEGAGDWQRLAGIRREDADAGAATANLGLAKGILAQTDSTLAAVVDRLTRVRELATQAGSGTLTDTAREAMASELDGIVEDLFTLANATDLRGAPLFGGATGDAAFVRGEDGAIRFAGEGVAATIPVGQGARVQVTEDGSRIFGGADGATDMFATLRTLATALRDPAADMAAASGAAIDGTKAAAAQATNARTSAGARAARVEMDAARLASEGVNREEARVALEEVDVPSMIVELQKAMTVLQATQASFGKLSELSLFNYLR